VDGYPPFARHYCAFGIGLLRFASEGCNRSE
jgi:hypothetical protein